MEYVTSRENISFNTMFGLRAQMIKSIKHISEVEIKMYLLFRG